MENFAPIDPAFGNALGRLGPRLLGGLAALELAFRRLHPPEIEALRVRIGPVRDALAEALAEFEALRPDAGLAPFHSELVRAVESLRDALSGLADPPRGEDGIARVLLAMHQHALGQALLYPLRQALPPVSEFFAEPFCRDRLASLEAGEGSSDETGLFRGGPEGARGGFDLYVPENWDGQERLPLIVALHGGSGNGADFLWTWLREARSRRCLLLAPTSRGSTWSLHSPELDGQALREIIEHVSARWLVDSERVLLTGLSDGATMTLLVGLAAETPYTHLAPVSGVLHPHNFSNGNLSRARGKPIQLVHGALDWMFPVSLAREAARVLEGAGAELAYHEIADLSHAYPREMNARLIEWLDPRRAVSARPSESSAP